MNVNSNQVDTLEFKLVDPVKEEEYWAVQFGAISDVVEIYINGDELVSIVKPIEEKIFKSDNGRKQFGDYGHYNPRILFLELTDPYIDSETGENYGSEVLCCRNCGELGCSSITLHVKNDGEKVYWDRFGINNKDYGFPIKYCFDKVLYDKEMSKLAEWKSIFDLREE